MKVSDNGGGTNFKPLEAGTHAAVCTQIVGIGPQETGFGLKEKIKIRFEVPAERVEWETDGEKHEGPAVIWATYTASLNEKANLRKDLEAWRGRAFTAEELQGFELGNLLKVGCMISVVHRDHDGKTYANIASLARLPKGMDAPQPEGDVLMFDYLTHSAAELEALPEWLQAKVKDGLANVDRTSAPQEPEPENQGESFKDDDIPF